MYKNPPTVVVGLIPASETKDRIVSRNLPVGLVVIKRGLEDGYGKYAFPGGYQNDGESWQQALTREVREETNILTWPEQWMPRNVVTVQNGSINLLFAEYRHTQYIEGPLPRPFSGDGEILELDIVYDGSRMFDHMHFAFSTHIAEARAYFQRKSLNDNCNCGTAKR